MKVLVIPDVHLKAWIFEKAREIMENEICDKAVCLMDLPDDWNKCHDIASYEETYNEAIAFSKIFPETLWVYGNHELSYKWQLESSGYSEFAAPTVRRKLLELEKNVNVPICYVQRIDNVLFSHGGLCQKFVDKYVSKWRQDSGVDEVLHAINSLGAYEIWNDESPVWLRPQYSEGEIMYKEKDMLQIVGHTPVTGIIRRNNLVSCDTFSTRRNGTPIGTREFLVVDTKKSEVMGIR